MAQDPRQILARERMGWFQVMAVTLCVLLNALDGFDVLSISFASPGIAAEWGINRAALGIVLSMELIGMALGSITIGPLADRAGRRPVILICLLVMSSGMYLASIADSVELLSAARFYTGIGIGGMLAAINAMAAEYANDRHRNLAITLMATGYPLGVIAGGSIASMLLVNSDWRAVFLLGSIVTAAFIPAIWFLLPESIEYLVQKRPRGALDQINNTLRRMGHQPATAMPEVTQPNTRKGLRLLFTPHLARTTILLTVTYFAHIMTFYFILKWIPKIVVDMGFSASLAGSVLVWANVGGATGSLILSLLTNRLDLRMLVVGALCLSAVMVSVFGHGYSDLQQLSLVAAAAGFFTNSAIVGLYAIFAQSFPTEARAGGTGFVIGVGRGGAALGPIVAGFKSDGGFSLQTVALLMAAGSVVAAIALFMMPSGGSRNAVT